MWQKSEELTFFHYATLILLTLQVQRSGRRSTIVLRMQASTCQRIKHLHGLCWEKQHGNVTVSLFKSIGSLTAKTDISSVTLG